MKMKKLIVCVLFAVCITLSMSSLNVFGIGVLEKVAKNEVKIHEQEKALMQAQSTFTQIAKIDTSTKEGAEMVKNLATGSAFSINTTLKKGKGKKVIKKAKVKKAKVKKAKNNGSSGNAEAKEIGKINDNKQKAKLENGDSVNFI